MIRGKCNKPECGAPVAPCHLLREDIASCEFWTGPSSVVDKVRPADSARKAGSVGVNWAGDTFGLGDISLVSERNSPIILGLIGRADAGKSSYLGTMFTLLLNGHRLRNFSFSQSKTIGGWEQLAYTLRLKSGKVPFPDPTPSSPDYYGFLHLGLRDKKQRLHDLLLTDTSGEVFLQWSRNRDDTNAASARWIHQNSNAFVLFIDCADLIERRNAARTEIIDVAQQLKEGLKGRPVIAAWSKADRLAEVRPAIREGLADDLLQILPAAEQIEVTNFSTADPDLRCHKNNLEVVDRLLEMVSLPSGFRLQVESRDTLDYFLSYRGSHGN